MIEIRQLSAVEGRRQLGPLSEILLDCVRGGDSVSFMASLDKPAAELFFEKVLHDVQLGDRILLAAFLDAELVGTVQVDLAMPPNQSHRADIAKLLVLRSARGQGIGARLMQKAEQSAVRAAKTLLVLDTATGGDAERLYLRLGWTKVGVIPNYAMLPNGTLCGTTIFWKSLLL